MRLRDFSAAALAACALWALACSDDDDGGVEPQPDPPVVSTISSSNLSPGDTLTINGSNFATPASGNQVKFTNPLGVSTAFAGSETQIQVVVDQDATDGPITVTTEGGSDDGPNVTINRGIGDFFVFGGLGPSNILTLSNPIAGTRYLVIPLGTNPNVAYDEDFGFGIQTTGAPLAGSSAGTARTAAPPTTIRETFEAWRWEQARELIERVGVPEKSRMPVSSQSAPEVAVQFYVYANLNGSTQDPSSFERVTAELRYNGSKCLIYADVDTLANPANNFDPIHFRLLGQAFDNSIEATNVSYFGGYSDVDNNNKVIMLITPVVNRLTIGGMGGFIAGFFLASDLFAAGQVPAGTTNHAEIFYLLAADPDAEFNPDIPGFPVGFTADENTSTTAHEHEHMISFSERTFNQGRSWQVTWLEEGMAHMAEALNGMQDANQGRTDLYLNNPAAVSLEHASAPLNQRGGIYLFLQLLTDRYGTEILKDIVQSRCTGRSCIESVTGRGFYELLAEFEAALYLSGKGITDDPRFNYTSINLDDFGSIVPEARSVGDDVESTVRRSSGKHYFFNGTLGVDTQYIFLDHEGIRLRNAIVRVQ